MKPILTFSNQHPIHAQSEWIASLCAPLKKLNIDYFGFIRVDKKGGLAAVSNDPLFGDMYVSKKYYDADIHMAREVDFGNIIVWDHLTLDNKSFELKKDSLAFGYDHCFTLVDKNQYHTDYFHFATKNKSFLMNQVYLANLDILKLFSENFRKIIDSSDKLNCVYEMRFLPTENNFNISNENPIGLIKKQKDSLLDNVVFETITKKENSLLLTKNFIIHKDTKKIVKLTMQLAKCLRLLVNGLSAKEIAQLMNLSVRTVETYILNIREILGCKNIKELLLHYSQQLRSQSNP